MRYGSYISLMILLASILSERNYYDSFSFEKPKNNFKRSYSKDYQRLNPEEGRNPMLRTCQEKYEYSRRIRGSQYQKSLLIRINKDLKGIEAKIEEDIQKAFLEDNNKSRRWHKRHYVFPNVQTDYAGK
jgi:hypothetical protein